jgi:hypothetical protein
MTKLTTVELGFQTESELRVVMRLTNLMEVLDAEGLVLVAPAKVCMAGCVTFPRGAIIVREGVWQKGLQRMHRTSSGSRTKRAGDV